MTSVSVTRDELFAAFEERGLELWLVGGALRDRLLGLDERDADYATDAPPDTVEQLAISLGASVVTVGQKYGTVGIHVDGEWVEITTFRGESYTAGSRWPDVSYGKDIDEDLARRDFTVNAMAERVGTGVIRDPHGGRADIAARIVRAVGDPPARFREDPLRILRGLRFASQLDFDIDPATLEGMTETAPLMESLSQERVTAELTKLLIGQSPGRGLRALVQAGGLPVVLPELAAMLGCEQNSYHHFDVWEHTVATVEAIERGPDEETAMTRRWLALLHDLGKPAVRHTKDDGEWGFYRHDAVGGDMAAEMMERLGLGRRRAAVIELLIRRHMDRPNPEEPKSVRRFMRKAEGHWRDLVALKRADNASHTYDDAAYHDSLEAACARAEVEDAEVLRAQSPLDGAELMAMFNRPPGRWIAEVKGRLSEMVLDGDIEPGDKTAAAEAATAVIGTLDGDA